MDLKGSGPKRLRITGTEGTRLEGARTEEAVPEFEDTATLQWEANDRLAARAIFTADALAVTDQGSFFIAGIAAGLAGSLMILALELAPWRRLAPSVQPLYRDWRRRRAIRRARGKGSATRPRNPAENQRKPSRTEPRRNR
ncbi:hypothetical protein ACGFJ7_05365 [Actinoplanes sp. NPDC048988]|uniref:hypothetical protein n=1 Tax=Actinoplanes sp. NPDC048988 TaxID=3363901 RepID=UPI0037142B3A